MITQRAAFTPDPVVVRIGHEDIDVRGLSCAIDLIRSLRHDRLGNFAELLLAQMEAAREPAQQAEAWRAFRTWSTACGLDPDTRHAA
ncbi:hypothetical protein MWN34_12230 [Ancylobacter sp. 6x-1]|uniref:Uncharacterized protein n=1 Tax=Ancylobacter crimeensis TaxID=2579147 RepID=A0ABT0DCJ4_9HYPH|nr:hypothetical protein [Ancylobacter crimeensis]MCK0197681.1 hypothetical protein [Ancylobacter crimeensis]